MSKPSHHFTRNRCAPIRRVWNAGIAGAIAAGALLWVFVAAAEAENERAAIPASKIQREVGETARTLPEPRSVDSKAPVDGEKPVCQFRLDAGPEMVVIASGEFMQGSPDSEPGRRSDESPRHPVRIGKPFAVGRCEVTVGEFRRFVEDTGYTTDAERSDGCYIWDTEANVAKQDPSYYWDNPGFEQTEHHPVTCVSWNDAKAYIQWLNGYLRLPEKPYRLPTESEWEYAVRSGSESPYYWGNLSQCHYANGADRTMQASKLFPTEGNYAVCEDTFVYTAPAGSFKPNAWNLYDMAGNVWEWVEDCWHDNYQGAPEDGSAWLGTDEECTRRSVRGGGWGDIPRDLRSAFRDGGGADDAYDDTGFRLARTL